jgi:hypothetical protein
MDGDGPHIDVEWMVDDLVKFFIDITKSFEFVHQIFSLVGRVWSALLSYNLTHFFNYFGIRSAIYFTLCCSHITCSKGSRDHLSTCNGNNLFLPIEIGPAPFPLL